MELYPHNQIAYDASVIMLAEAGKACVIHPTGTGKSFIGLQYAVEHPEEKMLWLSPSRYIFDTQLENWVKAGGQEISNITFCTYHKLSSLEKEELQLLSPDIIVFDEAHRALAPTWSEGVYRLLVLFPTVQMLGLTATNIRYLDSQRDVAEELFDGCVSSEMTLGEAIVRGILPAPKYVTTLYAWQKELGLYEERAKRAQSKIVRDKAEELLQALRRALELADGLDEVFNKHMTDRTGKYLVFTPNFEVLQDCMEKAHEWFGLVDENPHLYYLYTLDAGSLTSFDAFKADNDPSHLRLLFAIDALNEGIHVEDLSGVILFRPTISPIVYKQQIGRALSSSGGKTPVIFDVVNNFENLYSVGMLEEEMKAAITYYNYGEPGEPLVTENFQILDEVRDARKLFDEIENVLSAPWQQMYECAVRYHETFGDLLVSQSYKTPEGYPLGSWLERQRRMHRQGELEEERVEKLDALGMRWDLMNDISWERHYQLCVQYREENGNLEIPSHYVIDGIKLGMWILNARKAKRYHVRSNYYTKERLDMLDALGMVWEIKNDVLWERNFQAAKAWYEEHGNLEVPSKAVYQGVKLGMWLGDLRKVRNGRGNRRSELTEEQIQSLDAIGMRWRNSWDLAWEKGYEEAKQYVDEHEVLDAPYAFVSESGYKLGNWLRKQRENYKKGKLASDRIAQLEELGVVWDRTRENDWDECFEAVKEFYEREGHLNIPNDYKSGRVWLNKWLSEQRQILNGKRDGKTLTDEQTAKLASLGFTGKTLNDVNWEQNYAAVKAGQKGRTLTNWINNQRRQYRAGRLSPERIEMLRELGVIS